MRIGVLAPPWAPVPPPFYGGIELVVDLLARGYAAAGHDVLLFTTGDSTCPVPRASVLPAAEGERIGAALPEVHHALAGYEAFATAGVDIVHDHTVVGPALARAAEQPVVTTAHGPIAGEAADVYRRLPGVALVAISQSQRRDAPDVPVAAVVHHGVDAAAFPFGDGSGGYALFLGRMSPDKGAHRAILAARAAGVPILLAAKLRSDDERRYFHDAVEPLLGDDARYLGEVPHHQKLDLLAGAVALLFPIRWNEPFGLVMLEALACGTPVLAFAEGAAPEVVEPGVTGFICGDEQEMASALGEVAGLDRAACRAAVETRFSSARMVSDYLDLFVRLHA